jgi:hypothetical protein
MRLAATVSLDVASVARKMGMPSTGRTTGVRFSIGARVVVREDVSTEYAGKIGIVTGRLPNRHSITLDKYVIQFESGQTQVFWDVQLKMVS